MHRASRVDSSGCRNSLVEGDLIAYVNHKLFPYPRGFRQRASGPDTIEYKIGCRPKRATGRKRFTCNRKIVADRAIWTDLSSPSRNAWAIRTPEATTLVGRGRACLDHGTLSTSVLTRRRRLPFSPLPPLRTSHMPKIEARPVRWLKAAMALSAGRGPSSDAARSTAGRRWTSPTEFRKIPG